VGQVREALEAAGLAEALDYFDIVPELAAWGPWPRCRWATVFVVPGGSEGHYIHVEATALRDDSGGYGDARRLVILGKTFEGLDRALEIAAALTRALHRD
jgi:hypothetical protein